MYVEAVQISNAIKESFAFRCFQLISTNTHLWKRNDKQTEGFGRKHTRIRDNRKPLPTRHLAQSYLELRQPL